MSAARLLLIAGAVLGGLLILGAFACWLVAIWTDERWREWAHTGFLILMPGMVLLIACPGMLMELRLREPK